MCEKTSAQAFLLKLSLLGCLLATTACGSDSESDYAASDITDQAPTGSFVGGDWTAKSTVVDADEGDDELHVEISAVEMGECGDFASSPPNQIMFSVPRMEGEYPLSFGGSSPQTVTFYDGDTNYISTDGLVTVEALSDTEVTIGIIAKTEGFSINGRFTTKVCASGF